MRDRVAYLRQQADELRRLGEREHDPTVRVEYFNLATTCDSVANNIEKNFPVHDWARERASSGGSHNGQT
jgi:hypothetical protein